MDEIKVGGEWNTVEKAINWLHTKVDDQRYGNPGRCVKGWEPQVIELQKQVGGYRKQVSDLEFSLREVLKRVAALEGHVPTEEELMREYLDKLDGPSGPDFEELSPEDIVALRERMRM